MPSLGTRRARTVVGLEIEAGSIAAAAVRNNGGSEVVGYGSMKLDPGIFSEGEVLDAETLALTIKELFAQEKLPREVRLGIANQRVAVRSMQLPAIENAKELEQAIRFTAAEQIPMPLEQSMLDWQVIGHSQNENGERQATVVAVAARRDMLAQMLTALRSAGLKPEGIDHSSFGMIRALARETGVAVGVSGFVAGAPVPSYEERLSSSASGLVADVEQMAPARLYANLGSITNLAVARGSSCLFTRVASFGVEGIVQDLSDRRQLTLEHARQWLSHVGLEQPVESIEGDAEHIVAAREVLAHGVSRLADEIRLSIDYYGAQEGAVAIDGVVACGLGTTIPGLVERLQRELGRPFTVARPAALSHLGAEDAARLTLPYGLALEE